MSLSLKNVKVLTWYDYYSNEYHIDKDEVEKYYGTKEELSDICRYEADIYNSNNKYVCKITCALFDGISQWFEVGLSDFASEEIKSKLNSEYLEKLDIEGIGWIVDDDFGAIKKLSLLFNRKAPAERIFEPYLKEIGKYLGENNNPHNKSVREGIISGRKEPYTINEIHEIENNLEEFSNNYDKELYSSFNFYVGNSKNVLVDFEIRVDVDGDWKHDHLAVTCLIEKFCKQYNYNIVKAFEETYNSEDDGDDWYYSEHVYYICEKNPSSDNFMTKFYRG